ncbi:MAG: flagellar assembly protein T N-terminal domain-containing protein [Deltaproteobacteria bacterium]|nr:flagellar assembly protein T N-terminal domain-containing protein [Deltaproteobacteria bacterium]
MKKALLLSVFLLALSLALAGAAAAEPSTVTALGSAPVKEGESAAREAALNAALEQAVGQAAVALADPATLQKHLADLDQKILARARELVRSYRLEASTVSRDRVWVVVSVTLDQKALLEELTRAGLRVPATGLGRILPLVAEDNSPDRPPVFWWNSPQAAPAPPAAVAEVFKSLGVEIPRPPAGGWRLPPEAMQPVVGEEEAVNLGRQAGASLVLLGSIRTYPLATPQGQTPPPQAQLMVLDVASGQSVGLVEEPGPVFSGPPTPEAGRQVDQAVEKALRAALAQAAAARQSTATEGSEVLLTLEGVKSQAVLSRFTRELAGMDTVVKELTRESVGGGKAVFRVKLLTQPSRFADELMIRDYGDFLVNLVESNDQEIRFMVLPK